jgi:hypothetical protein
VKKKKKKINHRGTETRRSKTEKRGRERVR